MEELPKKVDDSGVAIPGKPIGPGAPTPQEIATTKELHKKMRESDLAILDKPIARKAPKLQPWQIAAMKELPKKCMR